MCEELPGEGLVCYMKGNKEAYGDHEKECENSEETGLIKST